MSKTKKLQDAGNSKNAAKNKTRDCILKKFEQNVANCLPPITNHLDWFDYELFGIEEVMKDIAETKEELQAEKAAHLCEMVDNMKDEAEWLLDNIESFIDLYDLEDVGSIIAKSKELKEDTND
jgi:hypothetical protein